MLALGLGMVAARSAWTAGTPILVFALSNDPINYMIAVSTGSIAMRQCRLSVAATQFGLYMAIGNFGRTIAAALLGPLDRLGGPEAVMFGLAATGAIGMAILLWARCLNAPDQAAG